MYEKELSRSQLDVLRKIINHYRENGAYPRNKELVEMMHVSKAKISADVCALEDQGYIKREEHVIVSHDKEKVMTALKLDMISRLEKITELMNEFGITKIDSKGLVHLKAVQYEEMFCGSEAANGVSEGNFKFKLNSQNQARKEQVPQPIKPDKKEKRFKKFRKFLGGKK